MILPAKFSVSQRGDIRTDCFINILITQQWLTITRYSGKIRFRALWKYSFVINDKTKKINKMPI